MMDTNHPYHTGAELHALRMDAAKTRALRLRQEAMHDLGSAACANVWRGANATWQRLVSTSAQAARSARRFQSSLERWTNRRTA